MVARACNEVTELRMRMEDDEVLVYERIDIGCAILKDNHTFLFAYMDYKTNSAEFVPYAQQIIEDTKQLKSLRSRADELALIHCSVLPWITFTSIKHPRDYEVNASIPKIMIGRFFEQTDRVLMPVSLQAHHALVDGYHAGLFYKEMQEYVDSFSEM